MELKEVLFVDNLPSLDLHGFDRDYARVKVLEFIKDNIVLKNDVICIVPLPCTIQITSFFNTILSLINSNTFTLA